MSSRRLLILLYFLSGAGALAIETVWMRWLRLLLGATAPAASATLVAFFAGHALGAAWGARRAGRFMNPLAAYGWLELAGAATAAAVPLGLAAGQLVLGPGYDALRESPAALTAARFALALVATLPAACCFGATFPALGAAALRSPAELGTRGAALYAVNTLGAALGTALATFWLPGLVGVRATYGVALALLVSAGTGALLLAQRRDRPVPSEATPGSAAQAKRAEPASRAARRSRAKSTDAVPLSNQRLPLSNQRLPLSNQPQPLLALAALSGFCAFALQVLLVQSFGQVLNQSIYAFGAVLLVVLLAVAAAGASVVWLTQRSDLDPSRVLGLALAAAALACASFPAALARATDGLRYVGSAAPGLAYLGAALAIVATAAGPALLAGSLVLPLTFALAGRRADPATNPGTILGRLAAANTVGAIAGAIAAPYGLLPALGLWPAFLAIAGAWALAALWIPAAGRARRGALLASGALAIALVANPLALPLAPAASGERALFVETTPAGVVAVMERGGERLIRVDGHYALGGTAERVHHERQAHLPLLLAPEAKSVAYVGSATGISAGGALAHPIASLFLVELLPGVAHAAEHFFGDANRGVYRDPRTRVVLDDARNFLRATRERFDVVIGDLFVPWQAGAGALYAHEHFAAVRERLEPEGLFCQWLPLYQLSEAELRVIAATFLDVFPRAGLFRGDFFGSFPIAALVGFAGEPAPPAAVSAAAVRLGRAGVTDRWVTDPDGPWALYVGPLAPFGPALEATPRNRDDRPWVERLAAAGHAGGERGKLDPVVGLAWTRVTERLRAAAQRAGDPLYGTLPPAAARAAEGGAWLQEAGALYSAGRIDASARAFARAETLLPARLVAAAPADATAAELWRDE